MNKEELFNRLICKLEDNGINYAITGQTEGYPTNIGSDVDIIVPRNQIKKFQQLIWEIDIDETRVIQMFQHECTAFYYIIVDTSSDGVCALQPDVCTDYYRKGRLLLTANYLLENSQKVAKGGFRVLSPEKEFIYYLLKKIDKRSINKEQFEHLLLNYKKCPEKALEEIQKFWHGNNLRLIKDSFESNEIQILIDNLEELQKEIHATHQRTLLDSIKNFILKIKRIINPTGFVIGVLGPDGSGKTTVINQVKEDISPAFRSIAQYHLYPKVIKNSQINTAPHQKKKRNWFFSTIKLCYLALLYNIGWVKYIIEAKIRSTLIIFDRYYDDILIDPIRYRNGTPNWMVCFFRFFIPQPQLWIVLDAPTAVIQARKSEVSPEETERQRQAYISYAKSRKNCLLVNTNRDVSKISKDICQFICIALHQRAIKRYKK